MKGKNTFFVFNFGDQSMIKYEF